MFQVDACVPATRLNIDRWHTVLRLLSILIHGDCGAFFWSLQTEFWADRFATCVKCST